MTRALREITEGICRSSSDVGGNDVKRNCPQQRARPNLIDLSRLWTRERRSSPLPVSYNGSAGLLYASPSGSETLSPAAVFVMTEQYRLAIPALDDVSSASASGGSFAFANPLAPRDHPLRRYSPFLDSQEIARYGKQELRWTARAWAPSICTTRPPSGSKKSGHRHAQIRCSHRHYRLDRLKNAVAKSATSTSTLSRLMAW